jgi:hypothetical protein
LAETKESLNSMSLTHQAQMDQQLENFNAERREIVDKNEALT